MNIYAIALAVIVALVLLGGCATRRIEANAPPIGRFVEIGKERLHYLEAGPAGAQGSPIVLIHGASVNLRDMKLALGDELAKSHRVVMVDRPGRGYSTRPEDGWRLERQAEIIHDALRELGVEKPVIVGQSFGGAVALSYALKYQNEMSGLVLLATVSHEWPGGVAWYNRASGWPIVGQLLQRIVIPIYGPLAAKKGVAASFGPDAAPQGYYDAAGLALLFRARDFRSNAADLRNLKRQIVEMSGRYGEIKVPTVIITGAEDRTVSPKIHSTALAQQISGARFETLPETGHALHHAEKAKIVEAIEFLAAAQRGDMRPTDEN